MLDKMAIENKLENKCIPNEYIEKRVRNAGKMLNIFQITIDIFTNLDIEIHTQNDCSKVCARVSA